VPGKKDGGAGVQGAAKVAEQCAIGTSAGIVGSPQTRREASLSATFGDRKVLDFCAMSSRNLDGPRSGVVNVARYNGSSCTVQLAARPAADAGSPSHAPSGDSVPSAPTAQPKMRWESALST
jgi:hypothetical protein